MSASVLSACSFSDIGSLLLVDIDVSIPQLRMMFNDMSERFAVVVKSDELPKLSDDFNWCNAKLSEQEQPKTPSSRYTSKTSCISVIKTPIKRFAAAPATPKNKKSTISNVNTPAAVTKVPLKSTCTPVAVNVAKGTPNPIVTPATSTFKSSSNKTPISVARAAKESNDATPISSRIIISSAQFLTGKHNSAKIKLTPSAASFSSSDMPTRSASRERNAVLISSNTTVSTAATRKQLLLESQQARQNIKRPAADTAIKRTVITASTSSNVLTNTSTVTISSTNASTPRKFVARSIATIASKTSMPPPQSLLSSRSVAAVAVAAPKTPHHHKGGLSTTVSSTGSEKIVVASISSKASAAKVEDSDETEDVSPKRPAQNPFLQLL